MLPAIKPNKKPVYLDHAATTPLDPRVRRAMEPFWTERFGNPSSLYRQGREADFALRASRATIAQLIGARPEEIVFTAGGTESANLAIFGIARQYQPAPDNPVHIIASAVEHHAVLKPLEELEREGCSVTFLKVDDSGLVRLDDLKKAVRPETVLLSVMYANNEIGTVEPIAEIGKWLKGLNQQRAVRGLPKVVFHTDACQAAGVLDLNVSRLGVDLMTVNGSKIYGPKQVGFLYVRTGTRLRPAVYGGGQEKNLRSGTENVPAVVGLAEALRLASLGRLKENARLRKLRDYFITQLLKRIPKVVLNGLDERGDTIDDLRQKRLPNNVNVSILDAEGEALMLYLDSYNIAASTGSACTSQSLDPSHVILALGKPYEYAHGSLRFTLGRSTTKQDIDFVLKVLPGIVAELRRISPVTIDEAGAKPIASGKAFVGMDMRKFKTPKSRKDAKE